MEDKTAIPNYIFVNSEYIPVNITILVCNVFSLITNLYFLIKSITYSKFKKRIFFRIMVMTLSCQYIFVCSYHIFYNSFIIYHNFKRKSIFQRTCAKLDTIDMYINEIIMLSLFFFNIFRYFKVIKQRLPNIFIISVIVIILLFPPLYFVFGQVFELKLRYTKNMICIHGIASNMPLYKVFETENLIVLVILPLISFALNYYIFWKLKNIRNRHLVSKESFNESKHLFISITIQSIFPFICQVPTVLALLYYSYYQIIPLGLNIIVQFLYYSGQGICIFLSLVTISHFREMMKRDMVCKWTKNTIVSIIS